MNSPPPPQRTFVALVELSQALGKHGLNMQFSLKNVHQEHFVGIQLQDKAILCGKCYF